MRVVQTYWTNKGRDVTCGFTFPDAFIKMANVSVCSLLEAGHTVSIYTDKDGMAFLHPKLIASNMVDWHIVNYDKYDFDKRFWNFPKLVTYSMQEKPFIHVDLDIAVKEGFASGVDLKEDFIFTELIRPINYEDYAKYVGSTYYFDQLICSGILGGTPLEMWKVLFEKAKVFCKSGVHDKVTFEMLVAIEEFETTKLVKRFDAKVIEADKTTFTHMCGANKYSRFGDFIWNEYSKYQQKYRK